MKKRTSINQNTNFSDKRISDTEELELVTDYFKMFFIDECSSILRIIQICV